MASADAGRAANATLVIPVGSTEQHGPHLPLSTDSDIAVTLAERLAAGSDDVVVAPVISYGASGEHESFPGTLSIGNAAIELVLIELVRSAMNTWTHVILLNAHGGNELPVRNALRQLRSEGRAVDAWSPSWPGDAHAGHTETSVMLSIDAALVKSEAAQAGSREPLEEIIEAMRAGGVAAVSANGVLGDPAGADAEHGEHLLNTAVQQLTQLVADRRGRSQA